MFGDFEQTEDSFIAKLPPCSVVKFTVEMRECKKCPLLEAGKDKSYSQIGDLLSLADSAEKVDKSEYIRRLSLCRGCDF